MLSNLWREKQLSGQSKSRCRFASRFTVNYVYDIYIYMIYIYIKDMIYNYIYTSVLIYMFTSWVFLHLATTPREFPADSGGRASIAIGDGTTGQRSSFVGIDHPRRLRWNLRIHPWKRNIIQPTIFRFYVNLPGVCFYVHGFSVAS